MNATIFERVEHADPSKEIVHCAANLTLVSFCGIRLADLPFLHLMERPVDFVKHAKTARCSACVDRRDRQAMIDRIQTVPIQTVPSP